MQVPGRERGVDAALNVTPLIDVCLVLLIIFMVVTPMFDEFPLPRAPHPEAVAATAPPPVVLSVRADGSIRLGDEGRMAPDVLRARLDELHQRAPGTAVQIRGDRGGAYAPVKRALVLCAEAGFRSATLLAETGDAAAAP